MRRLRRLARWAAAVGLIASGAYVLDLPDVSALKARNPATTAYIRLRQAQARSKGRRLETRMVWVGFDDISDNLKHAVVVAEDDGFYLHHGVDWAGLREALRRDWALKRLAYGGSTITQQVARNLYLSPSKNPLRKVKELLIARRLERALGKRRILELYLNIAEWGQGIFGCEAASRAYFGKSAKDLGVEEAAALAVVLPNPRRWDAGRRGPYVERNMRRVLGRMRDSGLLAAEAAQDESLFDDFSVVLATAGPTGLAPAQPARP